MLVIRVQGGLGNQMFQYALGRYFAQRDNAEVVYDISSYRQDQLRDYELPVWRIQPRLMDEADQVLLPGRYGGLGWKGRLFGKQPLKRVKEKPFGFHPKYLQPQRHAYYDGYWQSEKFFPGLRNELVAAFQPTQSIGRRTAEVAGQIESTNAVALHVRRTDYLKITAMQSCGLDYYEDCMAELLERHTGLEVFVFSDDLAWCEENLSFNCPMHFIGHNSAAKAHEDLWLMSLCRRHVIPNSTFSWWSAWLKQDQEGEVYAPSPWFNDPKLDGSHLAPEHWLNRPSAAARRLAA